MRVHITRDVRGPDGEIEYFAGTVRDVADGVGERLVHRGAAISIEPEPAEDADARPKRRRPR